MSDPLPPLSDQTHQHEPQPTHHRLTQSAHLIDFNSIGSNQHNVLLNQQTGQPSPIQSASYSMQTFNTQPHFSEIIHPPPPPPPSAVGNYPPNINTAPSNLARPKFEYPSYATDRARSISPKTVDPSEATSVHVAASIATTGANPVAGHPALGVGFSELGPATAANTINDYSRLPLRIPLQSPAQIVHPSSVPSRPDVHGRIDYSWTESDQTHPTLAQPPQFLRSPRHSIPGQEPPSKMRRMSGFEFMSPSEGMNMHHMLQTTPTATYIANPRTYFTPTRMSPRNRGQRSKRPFTAEEDARLVALKESGTMTWRQIAEQFEDRSSGTLQVRYCTKLKEKTKRWSTPMENKFIALLKEYHANRWRIMASKMGSGFSPRTCKMKALELADSGTLGENPMLLGISALDMSDAEGDEHQEPPSAGTSTTVAQTSQVQSSVMSPTTGGTEQQYQASESTTIGHIQHHHRTASSQLAGQKRTQQQVKEEDEVEASSSKHHVRPHSFHQNFTQPSSLVPSADQTASPVGYTHNSQQSNQTAPVSHSSQVHVASRHLSYPGPIHLPPTFQAAQQGISTTNPDSTVTMASLAGRIQDSHSHPTGYAHHYPPTSNPNTSAAAQTSQTGGRADRSSSITTYVQRPISNDQVRTADRYEAAGSITVANPGTSTEASSNFNMNATSNVPFSTKGYNANAEDLPPVSG